MKEECAGCKYRGTLDGYTGGPGCCDYAWITGKCRINLPKREDGLCPGYAPGGRLRVEMRPYPNPLRVVKGREATFSHEKMRELYRKGRNDGEIARALGCTPDTVYRWRKRNGLARNTEPGRREAKNDGI